VYERQGAHLSHHADGNVFWTIDSETKRIATFRPLRGFTGVHQIGAFAFSSDLSKVLIRFANHKKLGDEGYTSC